MKINQYTCNTCRGQVITRDLVEGTTPFMIACIANDSDFDVNKRNERVLAEAILLGSMATASTEIPKCPGDMSSCFYSCDQTLTPKFEWYKPELAEYLALDPMTKADHIDLGGLLLRRIEISK